VESSTLSDSAYRHAGGILGLFQGSRGQTKAKATVGGLAQHPSMSSMASAEDSVGTYTESDSESQRDPRFDAETYGLDRRYAKRLITKTASMSNVNVHKQSHAGAAATGGAGAAASGASAGIAAAAHSTGATSVSVSVSGKHQGTAPAPLLKAHSLARLPKHLAVLKPGAGGTGTLSFEQSEALKVEACSKPKVLVGYQVQYSAHRMCDLNNRYFSLSGV
jgi:hypothetical protein